MLLTTLLLRALSTSCRDLNSKMLYTLWDARMSSRGLRLADEVFGVVGFFAVLPAFLFTAALFKKSEYANLRSVIVPMVAIAITFKPVPRLS